MDDSPHTVVADTDGDGQPELIRFNTVAIGTRSARGFRRLITNHEVDGQGQVASSYGEVFQLVIDAVGDLEALR